MNAANALKLGRVSNLPTVWSNVLAGMILAGGGTDDPALALTLTLVLVAVSSLYVGGMFLNDAFDADWDRRNRPERPIPTGDATRLEVFVWGGAMLAAGPLLLSAIGMTTAAVACALALAILGYDIAHKRLAHASWIMGLCRALVYLTAGYALAGRPTPDLLAGAATLMVYVAGLTYVARTEHLATTARTGALALLAVPLVFALTRVPDAPASLVFLGIALAWGVICLRRLRPGPMRNAPAAVGGLIAGISLIDAVFLAAWQAPVAALAAVAAFAATRGLHRYVAGT